MTTNKRYTTYSQIGVGDLVSYMGIKFQVMVRYDNPKQVKLINDEIDHLVTKNWQDLEILSLMNE